MENTVEAFILAFGVITLIIALSISISLLGQVNACSETILNNIDREEEYLYVENVGTERKVGIETIIPTIYRAYSENYRIEFYKKDKSTKYELYKKDLNGDGTISDNEIVNTIDLENENWADYKEFLQYLINGYSSSENNKNNYKNLEMYMKPDGLYNKLTDKTITEYLGEYYQEDIVETEDSNTSDANKTKKRVIVYVVGE